MKSLILLVALVAAVKVNGYGLGLGGLGLGYGSYPSYGGYGGLGGYGGYNGYGGYGGYPIGFGGYPGVGGYSGIGGNYGGYAGYRPGLFGGLRPGFRPGYSGYIDPYLGGAGIDGYNSMHNSARGYNANAYDTSADSQNYIHSYNKRSSQECKFLELEFFFQINAIIFIFCILHLTSAAPLEDDHDPEDRRFFHHKRKKPCRKDASGRTFFDWNYSQVNVNNFFNDCGFGQLPINKPIGGGGHNQNQHHHGGGLFGGQHHGGGLFGGNNGNKGDGLFGLGLFNWLSGGNSRPSNNPKPETTEAPEITESENQDDDYQDEKPVNEDHDDIVLDRRRNPQLGYNPLYGNYDITNFNPTKVAKRVNKEINDFFRPFYDLF
ncbi:hypothetical protein FQR65_LT05425 [Abscondita terminalis]|nr:hypothetical protein FQR65_LT05425 [Abscondita terminalis]